MFGHKKLIKYIIVGSLIYSLFYTKLLSLPQNFNVITTTQITLYKCDKYTHFSISPISKKIAYDFEDKIWIMDIDGKNKEFIVEGRYPTFSASSEKIVYEYENQIWLYEFPTGEKRKIMDGARIGQFSPVYEDKIVYSTTEEINSNLWLYDLINNNFYQLTELPLDRKLIDFGFFNDGYRIFYITEKFKEGTELTNPETRDLWITNTDATINQRIISPGRITKPVISQDDNKIAFYLLDKEKACLWIFDLTNNETKLITCSDAEYNLTACFSPDNEKIAATVFDRITHKYKFNLFEVTTSKKLFELSELTGNIKTCKWVDDETIIYLNQKTSSSPDYAILTANFIKVIIDDEKIKSTIYPIFTKDEVYIPIKDIAEKLDLRISWDEKLRKLDILHPNAFIELKPNDKYIKVNDVEQELDYPPIILHNFLLVPIKFISYVIDVEYIFDKENNTVIINYKKKEE